MFVGEVACELGIRLDQASDLLGQLVREGHVRPVDDGERQRWDIPRDGAAYVPKDGVTR